MLEAGCWPHAVRHRDLQHPADHCPCRTCRMTHRSVAIRRRAARQPPRQNLGSRPGATDCGRPLAGPHDHRTSMATTRPQVISATPQYGVNDHRQNQSRTPNQSTQCVRTAGVDPDDTCSGLRTHRESDFGCNGNQRQSGVLLRLNAWRNCPAGHSRRREWHRLLPAQVQVSDPGHPRPPGTHATRRRQTDVARTVARHWLAGNLLPTRSPAGRVAQSTP